MPILIYGGPILLGFILGYFLKTGVLIALSVIIIVIAVSWFLKAQEIKVLGALLFAICGGILILAMWITWYFINNKTFIQEFLKHYILR